MNDVLSSAAAGGVDRRSGAERTSGVERPDQRIAVGRAATVIERGQRTPVARASRRGSE